MISYNMKIEEEIGWLLRNKKLTLSVAESCTGGLISNLITNVAGSSDYFERGYVVYSNKSKIELLDIPEEIIKSYGAVSSHSAIAMAEGVKRKSGTDIGLSITGIAGPTGGTIEKPVGLVYIAVAGNKKSECKEYRFKGERLKIKSESANAALKDLRDYLLNV
ncbi:MAG: CinA family protein [Nitrospinae bacterium]|nr:CinA family protein [Nitrospinota bacterium]